MIHLHKSELVTFAICVAAIGFAFGSLTQMAEPKVHTTKPVSTSQDQPDWTVEPCATWSNKLPAYTFPNLCQTSDGQIVGVTPTSIFIDVLCNNDSYSVAGESPELDLTPAIREARCK